MTIDEKLDRLADGPDVTRQNLDVLAATVAAQFKSIEATN